ncbi:hypothetical protein, partial [Actinomyces sp. ICM58]|uniref:hypothetical protein n=1 Tax=Actinomyces sp. ICM58 TaxID=1105030 RepID=UPI001EE27A6D
PAIPTKNTQKQKTGINKTNKHTIEFTNNTHTPKQPGQNPATQAVNHHHSLTHKLAATGE